MSAPTSRVSPSTPPPETIAGLAISLGFWCCLLLSAALFSAVALSPKILAYMQLRGQFDTNQLELVSLEKQAGRLQRVVDAIRNDKQFASEMTRIELDAVQPGEEVLPVKSDLKLETGSVPPEAISRNTQPDWYAPFVQAIVMDHRLRHSVLGAAALLVVVSFTLLQPAGSQRLTPEDRARITIWKNVKGRYVQRI